MATAVEENQPELEPIAIAGTASAPPPSSTATLSSCTNPYGKFDELSCSFFELMNLTLVEDNSGDQFEKENSATVKYLGPGAAGGAIDGKAAGSDILLSGSENHHKTEGSITKATVSVALMLIFWE